MTRLPFMARKRDRGIGTLGKVLRVTVLGAGVAGLAAALQLDWDGCDVTVIEARDEPGGRIRTVRGSPRAGAWFELGAARISSRHAHVHACLNWLGLATDPFYPDQGELVGERNNTVTRRRVSGLSDAEHLAVTQGVLPGGPGLLGALWERWFAPRWTGVRGGADQMPRGMAAALGARVRYGTAVQALVQEGPTVRIECTAPATGVTAAFQCDRVICTLPFTVLRELEVRPAFSPDKARVVEGLTYESAVRVAMAMDPSWEPGSFSGFGWSDRFGELWMAPARDAAGGRTLLWYALGDQARRLAGVGEVERGAEARNALDRLQPGLGARVRETVSFAWAQDPWARGAQSLVWDYGIQHLPAICAPAGRIHFAGEHTASRGRLGWLDGALESGLRAAREVQEAG